MSEPTKIKILEDTGNKVGQHTQKNRYFSEHGIEVVRTPLPCGDYALWNDKIEDVFKRREKQGMPVKKMDLAGTYNVVVDTKRDIAELCQNVTSNREHQRFRNMCILAQNLGVKLYILTQSDRVDIKKNKNEFIANAPITRLEDLHKWINPRAFVFRGGYNTPPKVVRGITLQKICWTMQQKYGCEFLFCPSKDAGAKVMELLGVKIEEDKDNGEDDSTIGV